VDAKDLLGPLVGSTLQTLSGRPNTLLELDESEALVGTQRSPAGRPVALVMVQEAIDRLETEGEVPINVDSVGYRSAFVGAALATYPGAQSHHDPPRVTLPVVATLSPWPDAESALPDAATGTEAKRYRWHLRAEGRNQRVVQEAKRLQGYRCAVCEVDYRERYGKLGERCVDAHHRVPFADLDEGPSAVDPRTDFVIVCSNCHRMLHAEAPPLSIDRLREIRSSVRG
jgi:hypothetical protein